MIITRITRLNDGIAKLTSGLQIVSRNAVSRAAAYQRATEIKSMLDAPPNTPSPAGQPPHTHPRFGRISGRRIPAFPSFIRFKLENINADPSAVIGPSRSGTRSNWAERIGRTHELGGSHEQTASVRYPSAKEWKAGRRPKIGLFRRGGERSFAWRNIKPVRELKSGAKIFTIAYMANYPKRPFALPALMKVQKKFLEGFFLK
jgi:hypothetical protein